MLKAEQRIRDEDQGEPPGPVDPPEVVDVLPPRHRMHPSVAVVGDADVRLRHILQGD